MFKTIIVLALLSSTSILASAQTSPRSVLVRFSDLDAQGKQLTPAGWQEIAALFVAPAGPRLGKITIVKDFVVSQPALRGTRAEFYVEYTEYGHIDPSRARFADFLTIKARSAFLVVAAPAGWRIEGTPPEPHLTVDAAIRYVTELRDKAADPAIKKDGDRTISILKKLKP